MNKTTVIGLIGGIFASVAFSAWAAESHEMHDMGPSHMGDSHSMDGHGTAHASGASPGHHGNNALPGTPADPAHATRSVAITMDDEMRFTPAQIDVSQGETIRFVLSNVGRLKHEMVLGSLAELKDHAELMSQFPEMEHEDPNAVSVAPGGTGELTWTFTDAGRIAFGCMSPGHFQAGMAGMIAVHKQ